MRIFWGLSLIIIYVFMASSIEAATYYTRTSGGDDTRSCATAQGSGTARKTINKGVECLFAGDTLIVGDGTYPEVVLWYYWGHQRSGTPGNPITIRAENSKQVIVQPGPAGMGQGLGGGRNIFAFENQNYWTVDGFITDGTGMSGVIHYNSVGTVGLIVKNFEARYGADNNSGSNTLGISTSVGDDQLIIQNYNIHHMGTGAVGGQSFYSYGMYFTATNSLIENGEISYCSGHGMHMHNTQGTTDNNTMRGATIHHNGILPNFPGILWAAGGRNNRLYQNVVYSNGGTGIRLGGSGAPGSDNLVANNTMWQNVLECITIGTTGGYASFNNTVQNNICYQNGNDNVVIQFGGGNVVDHNLLGTDPKFVNAAVGDFHLQSISPAINNGVVIAGISYNGPAPDQGAFETGSGPPPTTDLVPPVGFRIGVTP